jgi:hypothetical protein
MAYNITLTDSTTIGTIADGTVNSSATSLTLIGKNYAGYGNFLNQNFIKLLENFSYGTPPTAPQTGQLWYDSANKILKISADGSSNQWKPIASLTRSTTTPTLPAPIEGDMWWDQAALQLKVYGGGINDWITVGPAFSTVGGTSGSVVETILDDLGNSQIVIKLYISGSVIGVISGNTAGFTPQTTITGFPSIKYGFNVHSSAKFDGGDANNASKINGLSSNQFLRSDANDNNSGYNLTVGSLTIGGFFTQTENTANVELKNTKNNSDLDFYVTSANTVSKVFSITGTSKAATLSNALLVEGAVTANTTLSVTGAVTLSSTLQVTGNITPQSNGTGSVGTDTNRFANVFANVVTVTNTVNAGNVFAPTHVGTHANITNVNSTTVAATNLTASSFFRTAVYTTTSARNSAIPSPLSGMIVFVTGDATFYGYNGTAWVALN